MRTQPKGLNGESVWDVKDVLIGTVSGKDYGRKGNLKVGVDIRVERIAGPKQTVNHEEITEFLDFAITSHVWNPRLTDWETGGAGTQSLQGLATVNAPFKGKIQQLINLEKWHLNAMTAGCVHQPNKQDLPRCQGKYGEEIDMDAIPLCPETGYKWGSAWLVRPLPADFLDTLRLLFADADQDKIYDSGN